MPDNLKYGIEITSKYEGSEAKKALDDLYELRRQSYAAGVSTAGLDQEIATAERALGKSAKGVLEGMKDAELGTDQLKQAVSFLGRQFGDLGRLAHFAWNPIALGAALVGVGVKKLVDHLEALKRKAEETATVNIALWESQRQAAIDAANQTDAFATALGTAKSKTDELKIAEESELAVLKEIQTARQTILETKMREELAGAGDDKVQQEHIKRKYGEIKSQAALRDEAEQLQVKQRYRQEAQTAAAEAALDANSKGESLTRFKADTAVWSANVATKLELESKRARELETARQAALGGRSLDELKAEAEAEIVRNRAVATVGGGQVMPGNAAGVAYQKALDATEAVRKNQEDLNALETASNAYKQKLQELTTQYESAVQRMQATRDDAQVRDQQFSVASQIFDIHSQSSRDIRAAGKSESGPYRTVSLAASGADAIAQGQKPSAEEAKGIELATKTFGLQKIGNDAIVRILGRINDTQEGLIRAAEMFAARAEANQQQIRNLERTTANQRNQ